MSLSARSFDVPRPKGVGFTLVLTLGLGASLVAGSRGMLADSDGLNGDPAAGSAVASETAPATPTPPGEDDASLLAVGKVLLVGEQHGTVECPTFVLELARRAAARGVPVALGLEFPESELKWMLAFLDSDGSANMRRALLSQGRWQAEQQYGLTSRAMLDLLDGVRRLRREGAAIDLFLFDQPADGGGQVRDSRMAEYLGRVVEASKESLVLVLTGNIHSSLGRGTRWDPEFRPMGYLLVRSIAEPGRVVALDVAHRGGTAWACIATADGDGPDCGSHTLRAQGPEGDGVNVDGPAEAGGRRGWYHVGSISASPPATMDLTDHDATPAAVTGAGGS